SVFFARVRFGFSSGTGVSSVVSFFFSSGTGYFLTLVANGQDAGDLALGEPQARAVLERAGRGLEPQVEELLPNLLEVLRQLGVAHISELAGSHSNRSASRFTTLVLTESLVPASRSASLAS